MTGRSFLMFELVAGSCGREPTSAQHLSQGATLEAGGVRFRLWAPGCDSVAVLLEADGRAVPMRPQPGDFFEVFVDGGGRRDALSLSASRRARRSPIRPRVSSRRTCTARAR